MPNVIQDDTLLNPRHLNSRQNTIETFDYVVSNPPFNTDFSEIRNTLASDNIELIIDIFNRRQEVEDFSVLVSLDEIAQKKIFLQRGAILQS